MASVAVKLTTRNTQAVIANFKKYSRSVDRAIKKHVRATGEFEHDLAYSLCAVDTGFMRDHLRLRFSPKGLTYENGWYGSDFDAAGLPFYPIYVEFGTLRMAAQPALFPARTIARARFLTGLREVMQSTRRKHAKPQGSR